MTEGSWEFCVPGLSEAMLYLGSWIGRLKKRQYPLSKRDGALEKALRFFRHNFQDFIFTPAE